MLFVSCTRPPRVTTSSTTTNFSLGEILKPRRRTSFPSSFSTKMWRLPNERPTSWPTMIPPRAGEITGSQSNFRTLSASQPHTFAAISVCCRSSAHWKYSRLCKPERKTKWPSSSAPVLRNRDSRSSLIYVVGRFCKTPLESASGTDALQLLAAAFLSRCIIRGLVGLPCGGNYLLFHLGSSRQGRNLDGGTGWGIFFEIRAVYFVYRLKVAEVREEKGCLNDVIKSQPFGS